MSRINVMYVIWSLETGGAEQVVAALATGLDRERYRTMICCLNWEGELASEVKSENVPVFSLNKKKGFDAGIISRLRYLLRQEKVDVVHTHLFTANLWGRIAARLSRVPVVVATEHNIDTWKSRYHFILDRILAHSTDRMVYVSDAVESFYIEKTGLAAAKRQRIYNGIDAAPFRADVDLGALRDDLEIAHDAEVVTTIGRLVPQKGHRLFIDTMKRVQARCPRATGLIVGDGECRRELEEYIQNQGMQDVVRLTGLRQDIPQILQLSDVFVLSSFREGFPITILEAMAAGRPCVVTDVGGNREAVEDGVTGYVVPAGDPEALAAPIGDLVQNSDLQRAMSQRARDRLDRLFSIRAMVGQTESLYDEILNRGQMARSPTEIRSNGRHQDSSTT